MFSLDCSGWVQAADLVIWMAMDRPERAGKSWKLARHSPAWPAGDEKRLVARLTLQLGSMER
jgi:hypothetical protein